MNISSDLPSPIQKMAAAPAPALEAGEGRESVPDNEAAEAATAKSSLHSYQGTKVDLTA